jgi:hypothetical protein
MGRPNAGAIGMQLWFAALVAVSAALLVITIVSYAVADQRLVARVLFWFGLGGEANIGAWWSGMLLALAAFLTFDGFFDGSRPSAERRGWLALGLALLLLSFDEVASLHEYLTELGFGYLAVLGVVGLTVASYGMQQLKRARVPGRTLALLLLAFGLLASVAIQEQIQSAVQWDNQVIYGFRAFLEEGTELAAMLIFVSVGRATSTSLLRSSQDFLLALVRSRRLMALTALFVWPVLVAATFAFTRPGGPPAWLASTLLIACALLAAREGVLRGKLDSRCLVLILFYLGASAAANAVPFRWGAVIFGTAVNVRGIVLALLVMSAVAALKANGRRLKAPRTLLVAAVISASAVVWPASQILWCGLPPAFALWLYVIESKAAAEGQPARGAPPPLDLATAPMS